MFQIIDSNTVTTTTRGSDYTVIRKGEYFYVWCVNASSRAYRRGFPVPRMFKTLAEVEQAYKGLHGVAGAFAVEA